LTINSGGGGGIRKKPVLKLKGGAVREPCPWAAPHVLLAAVQCALRPRVAWVRMRWGYTCGSHSLWKASSTKFRRQTSQQSTIALAHLTYLRPNRGRRRCGAGWRWRRGSAAGRRRSNRSGPAPRSVGSAADQPDAPPPVSLAPPPLSLAL
jgi:hypothetical protein